MKNKKIFIAGHNGMVGSSVLKTLKQKGYENLVTINKKDLNLLDQKSVLDFFKKEKFDSVILCAAKVGGILANNNYRADFIYDNIQISSNIIKSCSETKVKKLINLGSSCIYPREAKLPIKEEYLLTGPLEYTNEPYAIAKIAALKMCESFYKQNGDDFYSLMPCNLYGPGDNFDLRSSHVLPGLIHKIHLAKINNSLTFDVWGSGNPMREFLYVDDLSLMIVKCLEEINASDIYGKGISHLNVGSDDEISIKDLALLIKSIVGFTGNIIFDGSKPDGTFRKKMDNTRVKSLGFTQSKSLKDGVLKTYEWFKKNKI